MQVFEHHLLKKGCDNILVTTSFYTRSIKLIQLPIFDQIIQFLTVIRISYRDATRALTGTYATDPDYGQKLNNLIEYWKLDQFD